MLKASLSTEVTQDVPESQTFKVLFISLIQTELVEQLIFKLRFIGEQVWVEVQVAVGVVGVNEMLEMLWNGNGPTA